MKKTLYRPILLVDEAQEVPTICLNELRILASEQFDSQNLLTTILCGDNRLPERFRSPELAALGSRIRLRKSLTPYEPEQLVMFLDHSLEQTGARHLMTDELKNTLADHAGGNLRVLCSLAAELLEIAADKKLNRLDEKLYIETYSISSKQISNSSHI